MITPSGKRRYMQAQFQPEMGNSYGLDELNDSLNQSTKEQPLEEQPLDEQPVNGKEQEDIGENPSENSFIKVPQEDGQSRDEDIAEYISQKLQSFGYPPRRLEQFENEFVQEKLFPGGAREMDIVIPDRYYGKKQRIKDSDFSSIVKEIQEKFGLSFVEAERKDKKIIMKFTSDTKKDGKEDGDEEMAGDILDEVYGTPTESKRNKSKKTTAMTMAELAKFGREELIEKLLKLH